MGQGLVLKWLRSVHHISGADMSTFWSCVCDAEGSSSFLLMKLTDEEEDSKADLYLLFLLAWPVLR